MTTNKLDETKHSLTAEQIEEVERASQMPFNFDDDSPEYSYEQLAAMLAKKKSDSKTQVVSIRLSKETLDKAKSLGKGYTGVMSRVITYAMDNPDVLRKCL